MKKYLFAVVLLLILSSCTPLVDQSSATLTTVSSQEFYDVSVAHPQATIIDVRTPEEYSLEHLEGATRINFYDADFKTQLEGLDKDSTYLIYCRSGSRSEQTLQLMSELGFTSVYNLDGGITAWKAEGLPLVS